MKCAACCLLSVLILIPCLAQEEDPDSLVTYALGEIVVTANAGAIVTTASIAEISEDEIRRMDAASAASALKEESSIFLSRNSRNESFLVLRGYDQRQIAVYFDGVPISVPYDGLVDLGMIPSGGLGKITVTKGMPSILYGANGMGGTINLVTGEQREGFAHHLRAQMGGTRSLAFCHGGAAAGLFWFGAGSYAASPGFPLPKAFPTGPHEDGGVRNNSQTSGYGALFKLGTTLLPRSTAGITLFHTQSSKGVPPSVVSVRPRYWRFPEWEKTLLHLTDQTNLGEALVLKAAAFFENYRNVLDAYDDQTYTTQTRRYAFHSTYDDDSYGATVTATVATLTSHLTRLAVHFKNDIHREHDGRDAPWERYETRLSTFGIEHEYAWGPAFALVAGASYDHLRPTYANASPVRPASGAWNGHAGIRYRSEGGLELRANAARRSRFPTLKELYSEVMGKNVANPHLAAERCWNGEVGCSWSVLKDLQLSLAVFRNTVQRVILLSTLVDGSQQFRNIGSARYQGAELAARGDAGPVAFQCHYTYLDAGNTSADAPSRLLPYRPRHLMNGRLSGRCVETLSWQVGFTSSAIVHGVDMDTGAIVRLADYTLLNVRVAWRPHTALELFVRLDNALDRYYETDAGFPQAGRDLLVGFDVSL